MELWTGWFRIATGGGDSRRKHPRIISINNITVSCHRSSSTARCSTAGIVKDATTFGTRTVEHKDGNVKWELISTQVPGVVQQKPRTLQRVYKIQDKCKIYLHLKEEEPERNVM